MTLAAGLATLNRGDLHALVYGVLRAARVAVPVPTSGTAGGRLGGTWSDEERFRAGLRVTAATMFGGAVAPSAAKKITALVTTLVANSVMMAAAAREEKKKGEANDGEEDEDDAAFAYRTASDVARDPPVVAAGGAAVESSLLVEGVLISEGIRGVTAAGHSTMTRRLEGGVRVAVLYRTALNDALPAEARGPSGHGGDRMSAGAAMEIATEEAYASALSWSSSAAMERAQVLADRGVGLLLCTEHVDDTAAETLFGCGIAAVQLVPEDEALRACRALGGMVPATEALPSVLRNCDIGTAAAYSEQNMAGRKMLYLRVPGTYTALVRGPSDVASRTYAQLVRRGLRAAAAALVPGQEPSAEALGEARPPAPAELSLVPGGGACEAALCGALRAELDARRRRPALSGPVSRDGDAVDRDAEAMALEVVWAMARAVPAALARATASTSVPGANPGGGAGGEATFAGEVVRVWRGGDQPGWRGGRGQDALAAAAAGSGRTPRSALEILTRNAGFADGVPVEGESSREGDPTPPLVGLVSPAFCAEANHPGTVAAIMNRSRPSDDAVAAATAKRHSIFVRVLEPTSAGVLEPLASKYAAVLAAVEIVATLVRLGSVLPSRYSLRDYAAGRVGREVSGGLNRRVSRRVIGGMGVGDSSSSDGGGSDDDDDDDDGYLSD